MEKKIAIIGASGEVGYKLVNKLCASYHIHAIVRDPKKKDFSNPGQVTLFKVNDINDVDELSVALKGCDVIINAGYIFFAEPILKAIHKNSERPKHIIFTGSTGVLSKLVSRSAEMKREAEQFIRDSYDFPWTIVRPTMIYGHLRDRNLTKLIKVLNKTPLIPLIGSGKNLIQPVFIDDLIHSYEIAILNSKFYYKIYNIGAHSAISNKDLFEMTSKAMGKKVRFIAINPGIIFLLVKFLKLFKLSPISEEQVKRFQEDKNIEISDFIKEFGFAPRSFQDGIKELVKEVKAKKLIN